MLLAKSVEPKPNSRALTTAGSVMTSGLTINGKLAPKKTV